MIAWMMLCSNSLVTKSSITKEWQKPWYLNPYIPNKMSHLSKEHRYMLRPTSQMTNTIFLHLLLMIYYLICSNDKWLIKVMEVLTASPSILSLWSMSPFLHTESMAFGFHIANTLTHIIGVVFLCYLSHLCTKSKTASYFLNG